METINIYPIQNNRFSGISTPGAAEHSLFTGSDFSFKDIFDVINPLQQLPIIGNLYRAVTGDTISTGSRLAGGFLLGGPIGFMAAAINAGLDAATGADVGEHLLATITDTTPAQNQYASVSYLKALNLI